MDLEWQGVEGNLVVVNAAISGCEKAGNLGCKNGKMTDVLLGNVGNMNLNSERLETHRNEDFIELQLKRNVEEKCMSHGLA
jgi:hypothetical protein